MLLLYRFFCVAIIMMLFSVLPALSLEEGLVGYWKFDEGSGNVAKDSSGNGNDGTLVRGPQWVEGKFGKALRFDATQRQKVEVPHSPSFATITNAVTIEAWVNPENFNAWVSFGVKGDIVYGMFINPAAFVRIHYSGGNTLDTPNNIIKANEWTHVVGTYDGSKVRIYINGEVKAEKSANVAIPASSATYVIGGTQESRDWFAGMIDECKLYNRGLKEDEIKKSMKGPAAVSYVDQIATVWGAIKVQ